MRNIIRPFLWTIAFMLISTTLSWAQPFTFDRIANQADIVPEQSPLTFKGFHPPSLAGSQVVFDAFYDNGAGGNTGGLYLKTGTGALARVIDSDNALPGLGVNVFAFGSPGDVNASGTSVFMIAGPSPFTSKGVYTGTAGSGAIKVADINTAMPGEGVNFTNFTSSHSIDTNGDVVFTGISTGGSSPSVMYRWNGTTLTKIVRRGDTVPGGGDTFTDVFSFGAIVRNGDIVFKASNSVSGGAGQGIYKFSGGTITKLVDTSTPLGGGTFATNGFVGFSPSFDGTNVSFIGAGSGGERGVYLISGGNITTVADRTTTIPGTGDTFTEFTISSIDGDRIVFMGRGPNSLVGLYLYTISTQTLVKIIDSTEQLDGQGIQDGFGLFMHYNGFHNGRLGFQARYENSTAAVYVTDLGPSTPVAADTVKVTIGMALAAPGDTVRIPVLIENASGPAVGGLQMAVPLQNITHATFIGIEDTSDHANFDVLVNEFVPGTVNFTLFSINNATVAPNANPVRIATLVYVVDQNAPLGSTNELGIQGLLIGDEQGNAIPGKICVGAINVGIKGDIDGDGKVTILDVIKLARVLVGSNPEPSAGTTAFKVADADNSGALTVNDITTMINIILNNPIPPTKLVSGPVAVTLDDVRLLADGQSVIPLRLDGSSLVAGMQARFTFDPSTLSVGTIQLGGISDGLQVVSHVEDGVLRVVVFRYSPEAFLTAGSEPLLLIPVTAIGSGTPVLTMSEVQLSTPSAQLTPVLPGNTTVAVPAVKAGGPSSFSLSGNAPNPFNPATQIAYDVPQQAHITLAVYNVLGQEVVRLVDREQQAGRYTITWDGRNAQGQAVSSGVYLYRLASSTGFVESRRMVLLK